MPGNLLASEYVCSGLFANTLQSLANSFAGMLERLFPFGGDVMFSVAFKLSPAPVNPDVAWRSLEQLVLPSSFLLLWARKPMHSPAL